MRYALTRTVAPTTYPVTVEEARRHLRVDGTEEDALIQTYIIAATELTETFTCRQLMPATYALRIDRFPPVIIVPKPPLQSVTSIAYLDSQGASQTLTVTTDYIVDSNSEPGRITTPFSTVWPVSYDQMNAVTVTFVAGYTGAGTVPESLKAAIKLMVGDMFQNRETTLEKPIQENPTLKALMWDHVRCGIGIGGDNTSASWQQEWLT